MSNNATTQAQQFLVSHGQLIVEFNNADVRKEVIELFQSLTPEVQEAYGKVMCGLTQAQMAKARAKQLSMSDFK